ncbi:MAG: prolyl oligopeptidase family serine peptidase [Arenimonas sp.]
MLVFDSNVPINAASITAAGSGASGTYRILDPQAGKSIKLLIATAGTYTWDELSLYRMYFPMRKDTDVTFPVKAGIINYPGDLIFRFQDPSYGSMHRSNRGLALMDWVEKKYPAIYKRYDFEYAGQYPDVFPDFYKQERLGKEGPLESKTLPVQISANLPLAPEALWRTSRIAHVSLSPDARYIAEVVNVGENKKTLEIINRKTGDIIPYNSFYDLTDLTWVSDDAFVMAFDSSQLSSSVVFVRIIDNGDGKLSFTPIYIPRTGTVIDPMLSNPDYFLFASLSETTSGAIFVHKINKRDTSSITKSGTYSAKSRVNISLENDRAWLTNGNGEIVAAVVSKNNKRTLMLKERIQYRAVREFPEDDSFLPVSLSLDGQKIYALTDQGRTQRELVLFDIAGIDQGETIFSKTGADINSVIFDAQRQPTGVTYYDGGVLKNEYFDAVSQKINAQLSAAFPDSNIMVIDKDKTGDISLIYVDSSINPGSVFLFDLKSKSVEKIDDNAPWLSNVTFGRSKTIKVNTKDGFVIESYLTMPLSPDKVPPLVVMPHGGPIGIRDDRHFDHDVQFLVSLGYAVLQVNFRGSAGFGKNFREAGKGSLGTAIEDDVDAVLTEVLKSEPVDKNNMCIMGLSYGGYSALVSSMRWPGRFKCAISFSGPTDRILSFSASDSVRSEPTRKWMEQYFGNPKTDLAKMKSEQPLYSYKKLTTPLLLIHGTMDYRVDYEHVARLQRMLTMAGNPPALLTLKSEGHGFTNLSSKKVSWGAIAGFLEQYLPRPSTPKITADKAPEITPAKKEPQTP